jgi:hypothetical protein
MNKHTIKPQWVDIHRAVHSDTKQVTIGEKMIPIHQTPTGLRFAEIYDLELGYCKIMQQNPHKNSPYAQRAKAGETLSWVIPQTMGANWILIDEPVHKEAEA